MDLLAHFSQAVVWNNALPQQGSLLQEVIVVDPVVEHRDDERVWELVCDGVVKFMLVGVPADAENILQKDSGCG